MVRLCEFCAEKPGNRKCSGCSQVWYCGSTCQKEHWYKHKFDCNTKKGPTTADYLFLACARNLLPTHQQTLIDYGFERAFSEENQSKLLGVYISLTQRLDVSAKTLHQWWKNGVLLPEIKKQFESLPPAVRGGYYPWLEQNQWVLDGKTPEEWGKEEALHSHVDAMIQTGWIYAGGSPTTAMPEIKNIIATWPRDKQICVQFCSCLLSEFHPGPNDELWILFGYCTCTGIEAEMDLSRYYKQVLSLCSFEDFFAAYTSSHLYDLFLAKGIKEQNLDRSHRHLKDVLALSPTMNHSVWDLKQFILLDADEQDSDAPLRPCNSVMVDYGFINCKSEDDFNGLKEIYATLFEKTRAEPPDLHRACIEGKLYEFVAKWVKITEKKKYKRLMKNPYPLPLPA